MMTMIQCVSPVDGSIYAERPALGFEAAREAVARARKAQKAWARRPLGERIALVLKGVARLNEMGDEVVTELAWQMGRPVKYGGEFKGFNERSNYMASIATDALAPLVVEDSAQFKRYIAREPHGVVFVIAPWNYPYMTAINSVAPALIAGNAVVLKHASQTLLTGERLARAFHEAGVPEDVFLNVFLDHGTASRLIADKQFDFVNFTGSVAGGQAIERAAAGTFTGIGLELGGKDPGYVMEDADLDKAAELAVTGATKNSGQRCTAVKRILVVESVADAFSKLVVEKAKKLKCGDPMDPETDVGTVINARSASLFQARVDDAVSKGAEVLYGKRAEGALFHPTVVDKIPYSCELVHEETFGPVIPIIRVPNDIAEVIRISNSTAYGLSSGICTNRYDYIQRFVAELEVGTVNLWEVPGYRIEMSPFGGIKDSGLGYKEGVVEAMKSFTNVKTWSMPWTA